MGTWLNGGKNAKYMKLGYMDLLEGEKNNILKHAYAQTQHRAPLSLELSRLPGQLERLLARVLRALHNRGLAASLNAVSLLKNSYDHCY